MTYSFNLLKQPFFQSITTKGEKGYSSLRHVLINATGIHTIRGDTPLETAALMRLLIALTHAAIGGPQDLDEWGQIWSNRSLPFETLNKYLDRIESRFDLFDPIRPFYQAPELDTNQKSVTSLALEMVSGNNAVLFDHHMDDNTEIFDAPKAARALITAQTFGLGGLSGIPNKPFTDSPWSRGVISFLEGNTLFETLMLNTIAVSQNAFPTNGQDAPVWEQDAPFSAMDIPAGYLDYLTWQPRKIILIPEGDSSNPVVRFMRWEPFRRLPEQNLLIDPFKRYFANEKTGLQPIKFQENRALWRDSTVFLQAVFAGGAQKGLFALSQAAELASRGLISPQSRFRLSAYGMANDKAKIEFLREEHLPLSAQYLLPEKSEALITQLSVALQTSEECAKALQESAMVVAQTLQSGQEANNNARKTDARALVESWGVMREYWGLLEPRFQDLMIKITDAENALQQWEHDVNLCVWNCFEKVDALAGNSKNGLKAAVQGRRCLVYRLNPNKS